MSTSSFAVCDFGGPGKYCKGQAISIALGNITDFVLVPNSDWIIGISDVRGQKDLVAIHKLSSTFTVLTNSTSDEESPSISPDGKLLAYISRENDPLGNVVIGKLSIGEVISIKITDEIRLQSSQESHPSLTNDGVFFASKKVSDPNSSVLFRSISSNAIQTFAMGDTPVVSSSGYVVWNQNGRLVIGKEKSSKALFKVDGFLRRAPSFVDSSTIIYLRYSADSNQDGKIDSTDAHEVVKLALNGLEAGGEESVLKYGDNQVLTVVPKLGKLLVSERTKGGYQLMEYQDSNLECSIVSAVEHVQFESFISLCSEKVFGEQRSAEWRYVVRNASLAGNTGAMKLNQNVCSGAECDFASILKRYQAELSSILRSKESLYPREILIDYGLRHNRIGNDGAYSLLKSSKELSPYTLSRLIFAMASSPNYLKYLKDLVQKGEPRTAFFASLAIVSNIAQSGNADLALNQLAFTTREFASLGLDVSPALKKASELSSAAGLRGLMKLPLQDLSKSNFGADWIKQRSNFEAKNYLVQEGNDAIAKGELQVAKSSFMSALVFDRESLGAKKGLVHLGAPLESNGDIDVLLKKTSEINKEMDAASRSSLGRKLLREFRRFSDKFDHESEYYRLLGWLSFQVHLAESSVRGSVSGFFKKRVEILKGIFGYKPISYLDESLVDLRRAERIERNLGGISPLLSQDLAIVLFEQGDYKAAFSLSLERVRSISALKFEDAEVASYFLSLASSAAGKIDEHDIAIKLAQAAELEARKTSDSALIKILKSKVYLYFQAGRYGEAAEEALTVSSISTEELGLRFKVLRVWFLRLAGLLNQSQAEFKAMDFSKVERYKDSMGDDVFELAKWLQREMTPLPLEKEKIMSEVIKTQTEVGFFGRLTNRVLGNTEIFLSRTKLAIDSSQKLARAGLFEESAKVLSAGKADIERVASDVYNRETPSVLGNWLDLSLVVSKDGVGLEKDMLNFLDLANKGCKKIDNGDRNKNCIAIKSAIESRMNLKKSSYQGDLSYHSFRPFYLSSPEKVAAYLTAESTKFIGPRKWVSLVSANRIEEGLSLWAKGVVAGELRDYDLEEVLQYFGKLSPPIQSKLNRSLFQAAKIMRLRQAMGLDVSGMQEHFAKLKLASKKEPELTGRFNLLTFDKETANFFVFDLSKTEAVLQETKVHLPVNDLAALKYIPIQVGLDNLASIQPILDQLKASNNVAGQLTICASKDPKGEFLTGPQMSELEKLYASTWDYFGGNLVLAFDCEGGGKQDPVTEDYFDGIDSELEDRDFFKQWSSGLTQVLDLEMRSELLDRLSKEMDSRKNNVLAYQVFTVLAQVPDREASKSYTALATIASRLKKWDLVKNALTKLEAHYATREVETAARLELLRMKSILAESTSKKPEVIAQWQVYVDESKAKSDIQATVRGLVSMGNYLIDKVSDFPGAQKYYEEAKVFADQNKIASFEARFGLAMIKMRSNAFNAALEELKQLESESASSGSDLNSLKVSQQLNSALFGLGRLAEASMGQGKTRTLFPKLSSTTLRTRYEILDLNLNGMILAKQGWYTLAGQQFEKALQLSEESKFPELMSLILANQGFWMRAYGFVESSVKNYERALKLDDPQDELAIASDKRNLGLASLAAFDLASAFRNLTEAEVLSVKLGLDQNLALSRLGLAEVYFKRNSFEEASKKVDLAVSYFLKDYNPEYYWRAMFAKSEILRRRGNLEEAKKDLDRSMLVALSLPPGQRLGLGPDTTWVDITIRDVLDRWLEFNGSQAPDLSVGIISYFQYREQVDNLTSIPGASQKLSDLTFNLARELGDGPAAAKASDEEVRNRIQSLSQTYLLRLPADTLAVWSLKSNVMAFKRSGGTIVYSSVPFERSVLLRYGEFSEKLLAFDGETEILRLNIYQELLSPIFQGELPESLSILASKEFLPLPLEMLGPKKGQYLGISSKVSWLLPRIAPAIEAKENGFWGGTVFDGLDSLKLVNEGAKFFKASLGGRVAVDTKLQGSFKFLEVSGHHHIGKDGLPVLAMGKGQNFRPLDVFDTLPGGQAIFLNICGTDAGSPIIRAIAGAKGATNLIDARGAVSELSSFAVSKTLAPLIASGQKIDEALQGTRDILFKQGKHASYWARFRAWSTF
jgi:tetratricopeptide (TPR) repeat protein